MTTGSQIGIGAKPNILLRAFAYVVTVASTIAVLVVAVLSIGFYAVVMPLGKVPPLRDAYQFLSRAYDGILARLGQTFCATRAIFPRCD